MGEFPKFNPETESERSKRVDYLLRIFELGLDSNDIIGYHGTSLEVVKEMIDTGKIKGGYGGHFENEIGILPKQLSIFLKNAKVKLVSDVEGHLDDPSLRAAAGYAKVNAVHHRAMVALGYSLDDRGKYSLVGDENLQDDLLIAGKLTKKEIRVIRNTYTKARKMHGVVFGLHKDALTDFDLRPVKESDEKGERIIVCPNGIDLRYLIGLEPEGQEEWNYFVKLQKQKRK